MIGVDLPAPSLSVSAVLHLGTLVAVLVYYRTTLLRVVSFRSDEVGKHTLKLLVVGTIPVLVGFPLKGTLERFEQTPRNVAFAMLVTVALLIVGARVGGGLRRTTDLTMWDAVFIGVAQAVALVPGVSRSGSTITAGLTRDLEATEAANFAFLLGIPAIAGAGVLSLVDLFGQRLDWGQLAVGFAVAAISGYAAIAALLSLIRRVGLGPFAIYAAIIAFLGITLL